MERVDVPCGRCRICCYHYEVRLEVTDDPRNYQTVWSEDGKFLALARRVDGSCIYLDAEAGCTLHDRPPFQPAACRRFDCRTLFLRYSPERRRDLVEQGLVQQVVFDAGEQRVGSCHSTA